MTLIAEPQIFTPAYNPCKFIYNSTNKNNEGFRYIFDIYEQGTVNKIAEYRVLPTYGTGYGEVDLSKLLGAKVAPDFQPYNYSEIDTPNSRFNYDVKIGEEYIVTFTYTSSLTNNGGNVKITCTHSFDVGDQVVVDAGTNTLISGLWTVIAVTGTTDFTINAAWSNVTDPTENGSVKYADNRKTIIRDIEETLNKWVFNGALPWVQFPNYSFAEYLLDDTYKLFLTSCPYRDGLTITPTQELWFNGFNAGVVGRMVFINSNGDSFYYDVTNTEITTQLCVASPNLNLTVISGSLPLIKDDTIYYEFYFVDDTLPPNSQTYTFTIDQRCAINDFHLVFLDRMGSWGSFSFPLRSYETGTSTKQSFNKTVEGYVLDSGQWSYDSNARGLTTYSSTVEKNYQLNTNWMSEEMAAYFQELITSPVVYFWDGSQYLACVVQETAFEVERQRNKNLIKKTVNVKLANQDKVNL